MKITKALKLSLRKLKFQTKNLYKSISFIWLISYLVIFMLPLITNMFVHFEAVDILTEQSAQMAEQIISIEQKEFDQLYDMCNTTYMSILNHPTVNNMMRMSFSGEISEMDAYELKRDLIQIMVDEAPLLDDVWIMFNNIGYGISTFRAEPMEDFFAAEDVSGGPFVAYENTTLQYKGEFMRTSTGIAYFRTLGISLAREEPVNMILFIDKDALRKRYHEFMPGYSGTMMLYDSNDEFIYSSHDVSDVFVEEAKMISENDLKVTIDGCRYVVSSKKLYNIRYIYLIEENVIIHPMQVLKMINNIAMMISVIFGLMIIFYIIKHNIKPINDIVSMLGIETNESNEYDTIKKGISQKSTENMTLNRQINLFKPMAMNNLMYNLVLYGNIDRYIMEHLDICLDNEYFILSSIDVDNMGIFFENEDEELMENNQHLMEVALINIFFELLEKYGKVYFGVLQNKIVILINSEAECNEEIYENMLQGIKLVNQHFGITMYLAQGRCVSSIDDLPKIYGEVQEQLENMQILGECGAVMCSVPETRDNIVVNEHKSDFVKYIFEADCDNAVRVLGEIVHSPVSKGLLKYFVTDMLAEAAEELSRKVGDNIDVTDMINLVMESPRVRNVEKQLYDFVKVLCGVSDGKDGGVETKVYELINKNFRQADLNITGIADKFNITPSYLSYKFRERYHVNILDYLGKLRIEYAKHLILETNGTIEDIYHECGYVSRATFIRQFKKYVDLTPSKFKELYY